jgi:hypothetical protein
VTVDDRRYFDSKPNNTYNHNRAQYLVRFSASSFEIFHEFSFGHIGSSSSFSHYRKTLHSLLSPWDLGIFVTKALESQYSKYLIITSLSRLFLFASISESGEHDFGDRNASHIQDVPIQDRRPTTRKISEMTLNDMFNNNGDAVTLFFWKLQDGEKKTRNETGTMAYTRKHNLPLFETPRHVKYFTTPNMMTANLEYKPNSKQLSRVQFCSHHIEACGKKRSALRTSRVD